MNYASLDRPIHLYTEFENYPTPVVEEMRADIIDRWTWDTGSEEDRLLVTKLEEELDYRKRQKAAIEAIQSTMQTITKQNVDKMIQAIYDNSDYGKDQTKTKLLDVLFDNTMA